MPLSHSACMLLLSYLLQELHPAAGEALPLWCRAVYSLADEFEEFEEGASAVPAALAALLWAGLLCLLCALCWWLSLSTTHIQSFDHHTPADVALAEEEQDERELAFEQARIAERLQAAGEPETVPSATLWYRCAAL